MVNAPADVNRESVVAGYGPPRCIAAETAPPTVALTPANVFESAAATALPAIRFFPCICLESARDEHGPDSLLNQEPSFGGMVLLQFAASFGLLPRAADAFFVKPVVLFLLRTFIGVPGQGVDVLELAVEGRVNRQNPFRQRRMRG